MAPSQVLPSVLWVFFGLSVTAAGFLAYGSYNIIHDEDFSWQQTTLMALAQLATMGFMVCTLVLLGQPTAALEVWRVFNVLICVLTVFFFFSTIRKPGHSIGSFRNYSAQIAAMFTVTLAMVYFALVSFWVRALPYIDGRLMDGSGGAKVNAGSSNAGASGAALTSASTALNELGQLDFWHSALYVILITATVIFGVLFIAATVRDGPPSVEKSWGGLGGGSGGWEISSSLTYLVATIAIGVLLISLIYHSDDLQAAAEKLKEGSKAGAATTLPNAPKTTAPAVSSPDGNKSAPAGTGGASTAGAHPDTQPGVQPDAH